MKRSRFPLAQRGFSLMELLVVVAIMGFLIAVALTGTSSNRQSLALRNDVAEMVSLIQMTREEAVAHNTTSWLLVQNDPSDPSNFARRVISVYQSQDANGNPIWVEARRPLSLYTGVYFDAVATASTESTGPVAVQFNPTTMKDGTGTKWLAYQFQPNGTCLQAGAALVLAAGTVSPTATLTVTNPKLREGLVIQRLGSVILFQDPAQIVASL